MSGSLFTGEPANAENKRTPLSVLPFRFVFNQALLHVLHHQGSQPPNGMRTPILPILQQEVRHEDQATCPRSQDLQVMEPGHPISGEGNGTPLHYSCLENPVDGGAWWATVHGVTKSRTRLSDFTFTFHFHALEKEMATHSSVLAWRIPGTGEPGGLPSVGSHRIGHD